MRISDWSSDVCSSDLWDAEKVFGERPSHGSTQRSSVMHGPAAAQQEVWEPVEMPARQLPAPLLQQAAAGGQAVTLPQTATPAERRAILGRSEEHTSELQSLMRISYAVFSLKKK